MRVEWDGRDERGLLPPGLYLYQLRVDGDTSTQAQTSLLGIAYRTHGALCLAGEDFAQSLGDQLCFAFFHHIGIDRQTVVADGHLNAGLPLL